MPRYRKVLTQEEINKVLFEDTDESDLDLSDEDSELDTSNTFQASDSSTLLESDSDSEEDVEDCKDNNSEKTVEWESNFIENKKISIPKFHHLSGPMHNLPTGSSALQYLKLYMSDEICEHIRLNTNKYAEYCSKQRGYEDKSWYPIASIKEIWAFFTILFVMSIVKMPRIADYWAKNVTLGNERIKSMLAKNRFLKIKHYFHISDR
ncbi:hypothetical protein AVEN_218365-1, partial [Araneus ventricosus]